MDGLFLKLYEDWSKGRITEYNFNMLSGKYQKEQEQLDQKITSMKSEMESAKQTEADTEKWVSLIREYTDVTELDAELLNTLIEKIIIHEAVKHEDGTKEQEIEIYYRFVGKI